MSLTMLQYMLLHVYISQPVLAVADTLKSFWQAFS